MPCEHKLSSGHQQRVFMRMHSRPRRVSWVCMRGMRGRYLQTKLLFLRAVPCQHVLDSSCSCVCSDVRGLPAQLHLSPREWQHCRVLLRGRVPADGSARRLHCVRSRLLLRSHQALRVLSVRRGALLCFRGSLGDRGVPGLSSRQVVPARQSELRDVPSPFTLELQIFIHHRLQVQCRSDWR
jgi:hypothetical protein